MNSGHNDPQLLYEWERIRVEPLLKPAVMASWEIRELVRAASAYSDIPPPSIQLVPLPLPCLADAKRNTVRIAEWGRNPVTVLHEVAHLAAAKYGAGGHGRVFLTLAIDLYAKFLQIDVGFMEASAADLGLDFIPNQVLQARMKKSSEFYDEEF